MLNIVSNTKNQPSHFHLGGKYFISLEKVFSKDVIEQINKFRTGEIDHLIIRGLPVSENLPDTPQKIRGSERPALETAILAALAKSIGRISEKGIENTIRFNLEGEKTNKETWHSHFQYSSSVFYCLRSDPAAITYFLRAEEIVNRAGDVKSLLTTPLAYVEEMPKFSLIEEANGKYIFSKNIFERSELEKYIEDLDLPDAARMLEKMTRSSTDKDVQKATQYLSTQLENSEDFISYLPGDIMMVHEPRVIRYSPGFTTNTPTHQARWLLALSIK